MTIANMKPSPKLLPRDSAILSKHCTDDEHVAYIESEIRDTYRLQPHFEQRRIAAHVMARIANVHEFGVAEGVKDPATY